MILSAAREPCRNSQPFLIGWSFLDFSPFHFGQRSERDGRKEDEEDKRGRSKTERTTDLVSRNGQPVVVQGGLLFEGPVKDFLDVVEAESANGRAGQSVGRRRKRGVNDVHPFALVAAFVRAGGRFCQKKKKFTTVPSVAQTHEEKKKRRKEEKRETYGFR